VLLASQVSIEPISLVGGILREKAVKLTVHVADDERVLRKALILAESLGQGQSSALAQPLGEGTLTVTLALSLTVALTELAFASPLARNPFSSTGRGWWD